MYVYLHDDQSCYKHDNKTDNVMYNMLNHKNISIDTLYSGYM